MKRLTLIGLLVLAISSLAWAQGNSDGVQNAKCTLTSAQAPELRGFRLEMTQERMLARFPGLSVEKADEFGLTKVKLTLMNHDDYPGGVVGRDRGVQLYMAAGTADGRTFLVDSSRFPDLKGVRRIRVRFIDGLISYLELGYDDSVVWNDIDEFVLVISKPLRLDGHWQRSDAEDPKEKELHCDGFRVTASVGGGTGESLVGASISLEDVTATRMIEKRQSDRIEKAKRQEEERRKAFKP